MGWHAVRVHAVQVHAVRVGGARCGWPPRPCRALTAEVEPSSYTSSSPSRITERGGKALGGAPSASNASVSALASHPKRCGFWRACVRLSMRGVASGAPSARRIAGSRSGEISAVESIPLR